MRRFLPPSGELRLVCFGRTALSTSRWALQICYISEACLHVRMLGRGPPPNIRRVKHKYCFQRRRAERTRGSIVRVRHACSPRNIRPQQTISKCQQLLQISSRHCCPASALPRHPPSSLFPMLRQTSTGSKLGIHACNRTSGPTSSSCLAPDI